MRNLRNYNIYFHLHTISGIFACLLLFVIFFAGSFSFFKTEITAWQNNASYKANPRAAIAYDNFIDSLAQTKNLQGRDISFFLSRPPAVFVSLSATKDSTLAAETAAPGAKTTKRGAPGGALSFFYNTVNKKQGSYKDTYGMGEFLYRLHFLAPLNQLPVKTGYPFGYLLAGIVSFLFLFALITGLLLHWGKIVSGFFTFRPWAKLKTLWTDAHTALGVIGFPYQFLYAVTGLFLIVNSVLVVPFSKVLYKGDDKKLYSDIGFRNDSTYNYAYQPLPQKVAIEPFIDRTKALWPAAILERIKIKNYGDSSMHIELEGANPANKQLTGSGKIVYHAATAAIVEQKAPAAPATYSEKVIGLMHRLHFGDYGGYPLKIVYFILGLLGCVVIISGLLIWQVARNKKNMPAHKRRFNFWTANIFIAICLSMFPVTAFSLIMVKVLGIAGQEATYRLYFYSWLVLSACFVIRCNLKRTNKEALLLGSLLALVIPIVSGICSGNWLWHTWQTGATDILCIDLLWLVIGIIGLYCYYKIRQQEKQAARA